MLMPAAAQRVEYRYDAAGNRVLKQIVLARSQAQRGMAPAADKVAGIGLTLWPNPTTGQVRIETPDLEDGDRGQVTIYTTGGGLVQRQPMTGRVTTIDISASPQGVYILRIEIDGRQSCWRVVKR